MCSNKRQGDVDVFANTDKIHQSRSETNILKRYVYTLFTIYSKY